MALLAALYPPDHPYHWTTIGEIADLNTVRLDEVQAFFRRYFHPANASIALAVISISATGWGLCGRFSRVLTPATGWWRLLRRGRSWGASAFSFGTGLG